MDKLSFGDIANLLFVVPGFLVVWTFRYFSKSTKQGEFEYLGLSFVWGMVLFTLVAISSMIFKGLSNIFKNDLGAAFILTFVAPFLGWFGSLLSTWKWFKRTIDFFRPENFGK